MEVSGRAEMNEKGYRVFLIILNTESREISSSGQNACLAIGLRSDPLRELTRSPDFIFRPQMHKNSLVAALRPEPLGSLSALPGPQAAVGAIEGNTLAAVGALCGEEGAGMEVRGRSEGE